MTRFFALSLALLASTAAIADTIYQTTDKRGNPVFTDKPDPTAKPIELKPTNTTTATPVPIAPDQPTTATTTGYRAVNLAVPSSIPNGLAPTDIGIVLQPPLQPGHRWQLMLDGYQQAEGEGGSVTIERLERGSHQLQLLVIDQNGGVVGRSAATDVFVYWPSKNR